MSDDTDVVLQSTEMKVTGVISAISAASIIFTFMMFEDVRRLRYSRVVFCMSLSDLIASIGALLCCAMSM